MTAGVDVAGLAHSYARLPCRPLRVVVELVTPLAVGPDPICLDSLLAERVALLLVGPAARDRRRPMADLPLPLRRTGAVWHASIGFPDPGALGREFLVKRSPLPVRCLATPRLTFWANGHPGEVGALLAGLQGVGRHRKRGLGQVRRVTVRPERRDWSLWREGRPRRPIPVDQAPRPWACYTAVAGFRPPVWDPRNQGLCVMPEPDLWLPVYRQPVPQPDPDELAWTALEDVMSPDA